jgi:CheY-like chemotaxis protein/two-component sensor histidine kinase
LLNVSKLQAEVITPEFTDFAIGDILAALRSVHSAQAENKGLHLRVRSASTMVRTDRALMLRLLGNLVTNAVHYTASGGVLIACRRRDGKQWLEVYDTGIGIDEDQIDFIFGEFTQGANTERNTGSGLGLYIVAKTARLLGLQIRVRSRLGRGSLFAIELPVTDAISHKQDQAPVAQSLTQKKLRVALVEDNTTVLEALRLTLEQLGHAVVAASTGQEAIAKLNGQAPDLIISDYRLDFGETGYDVIEDIRAIFGDALPALIITGDTDPALIKSMAERCITIHYKPLKQEVLLAFINQIKASRPA